MNTPAGLLMDQGEAGALPNTSTTRLFCLPQDIVDAKNTIQVGMAALQRDATAPSCNLAAADKQAVQDFYVAWRQFYCRDTVGTCTSPSWTILGMCDQLNDCDNWQDQLYAWQQKVAASCKMSTPIGPAPPPPTAPSAAGEIVKYAAIGAVALTALYVASKTGLPRLFPKGKR